ncbi:MAG: hypothetical protein ACLFVO_17370 [Chloroflexaceae bacterium]
MLSAAITRYHSLLTDPALAQASQQRLTEGLRSERLFFGDRPLVTVLRPRLLTAGQYAHLQQATHLVAQAARRVAALALEAAPAAALTTPFVLQERVPIAYEPYPALIDGRVVPADRLVDSDPFLFGSEVAGCLCRLSTQTLLNVSIGGGSIAPVFVVSERE